MMMLKIKRPAVRIIDTNTKQVSEYYAKVIFVNAAAINTNLVLLNSKSKRFPNGLGNDSGILGKYVAFHNYRAHAWGEFEGETEWTTDGRNPAGGGYLPRFRNVKKQETNFLRGYAAGFSAYRHLETDQNGVGANLKNNIIHPKLSGWKVGSHMMGETIPKETNTVTLDDSKKDEWGRSAVEVQYFL